MHWGYFFKGGAFSLFLILAFLTTASLVYQFHPQQNTIKSPVVMAQNYGQFPTVLGAKTPELIPINILLLGLDSRKGDNSARCDAIHMISFQPENKKIIIYSVPRGTIIGETYIANTCSQKDIEKITGVKADYVVKVGFSQVDGLLRLVNLPPSPTLQFLRDRKDYLIGDNQRSYNQATFLKDAIVSYADWGAKLPEPMQYLAYKMVDTDLPYAKAQELLKMFLASGVYKNPDNIIIEIKPKDNLKREEIHFTLQDLDWKNDPEFKAYQDNIVGYLEIITKTKNLPKIKLAVEKQLWLQIEDETLRNFWQTKLLSSP